jgi:hypothetical protein
MRDGAAWLKLILPAVVLTGCWGCGSSEGGHFVASTLPVKGKVLYKGKPLTQGEIVFEPDSGGREAHGSIQSDGTFELSTFAQNDGAVPGVHRVAVSNTSKKDAVPLKYRNVTSSKTEVDVVEGKADYVVEFK